MRVQKGSPILHVSKSVRSVRSVTSTMANESVKQEQEKGEDDDEKTDQRLKYIGRNIRTREFRTPSCFRI